MKKTAAYLTALCLATLVTLTMTAAPVTAMNIEPNAGPLPPKMMWGEIVKELDDGSLEVKNNANAEDRIILRLTAETYVADAEGGAPIALKDRKNNNVVAYYGPAETRSIPPQSNAAAIILNVSNDSQPPRYARVEDVKKEDGQVEITTDGGAMIAVIGEDTPLSLFITGSAAALDDITVGVDVLLWYDQVAMSFPARAVVSKAMILGRPAGSVPAGAAESASIFQIDNRPLLPDGGVKGEFPRITGISDKSFAQSIDGLLENVYTGALQEAASTNSDLTFSYEVKTYQNITSLIIHTVLFAGNTSADQIHTFVLDNQKYKLYTLTDLLGPNAYQLADTAIQKQIAAAVPGEYFTDENRFKGLTSEPHFYVDEQGALCIIFDKYSIAPGSAGAPVFKITPASLVTREIVSEDVYIYNETPMIPLRGLTESFGFQLAWDAAVKTITLTKGLETHLIQIGVNQYGQKQLEAAPLIKDDTTYVPVTFFEQILGGCYTIGAEKITFSYLK
ncbi:MAG: DUF3298 domain-containing protein [Clostridiales bacterium]|jgi:hypothetical protein|nr:DUF3298 domain-containing protein [Clostridiales bacterium]